jgi:type VI secretion system protein ImpA
MSSPEALDFTKLLSPIPNGKPTGVDLRSDTSPASLYYAIKDARAAARSAERQLALEGPNATAPPDWRPVLQQGHRALAEKTKDLEIVTYLIEALVREQGFAGLRDGFRLARELVERFWDELYPLPDQDGLAARVAHLTGLNGDDAEGTLLAPIAQVPITEATSVGRFSCVQYQEALALGKVTDQKARDRRIAQGAVPLETIQTAVAESSPAFYQALVQDLTQCTEQFAQLCAALDKRCGGQAPPSSSIRSALGSTLDTVRELARKKLEAAASAAEPAPKSGAPAGAAGADGAAADALVTREDAFRSLLRVAEFFRRTEPHTVVPYALEQIVRWGRMSLPELLAELIPEEAPRKNLFKQVGIRPPEPSPKPGEKK